MALNGVIRRNKFKIALVLTIFVILSIATDLLPFSILPDSVVTPLNYVTVQGASSCTLAKQSQATIKCQPYGDPVVTTLKTNGYKWVALPIPNGWSAKIQGVTRSGGGPGQSGETLIVMQGSADVSEAALSGIQTDATYRNKANAICHDVDQPDGCSGLSLLPNTVYYFAESRTTCTLCADYTYTVTINWYKNQLTYSDPFGLNELGIPNTDYCIDQTGQAGLLGMANSIKAKTGDVPSAPGTVSTGIIGQESAPVSTSSLTPKYSLGYRWNEGFSQLLDVFQPLAQLGLSSVNVAGTDYVSECSQVDRQIYIYKRVPGYDGKCYGVRGRSVFNGNNLGDTFCCSTDYCKTRYASGWVCGADHKCTDKTAGKSDDDCFDDVGCVAPSYTDSSGQDYRVVGKCVNKKCEYTDIKEECRPGRTYYVDGKEQCCQATTDGYKLGNCATIPKECPAGMCCLANNSYSYPVTRLSANKECCDANGDGVGNVADSGKCTPLLESGDGTFSGGLGDLLKGLGLPNDWFGLAMFVIIVFVVAILLVFILLIATRGR